MTEDTAPWRPELVAALRLLARVSEALHQRGLPRPILVGGGAAEYFSGSALMTGDIDLTSPVQPEVEAELTRLGFTKPEGLGHTPLGWVHPDLGLGFEIVASTPMDGSVDYRRLVLVEDLAPDAAFVIIPVEDLIADRMGSSPRAARRRCSARRARCSPFTRTSTCPISKRGSDTKRQATMASTISTDTPIWPGRTVRHGEFAATLAARRAALGNPEMPRNAGNRRTASKRALLKAIEDAGGKW